MSFRRRQAGMSLKNLSDASTALMLPLRQEMKKPFRTPSGPEGSIRGATTVRQSLAID